MFLLHEEKESARREKAGEKIWERKSGGERRGRK